MRRAERTAQADTFKAIADEWLLLQSKTLAVIPHNRSVRVLAEGEMPVDWREKLRSSKSDNIILLHNGSSGAYLKVLGREAQPLEGEGAISLARQLMNAEAFRKELGIVSIEATREAKFEGKYATLMRGTDRSSVEETKHRTK